MTPKFYRAVLCMALLVFFFIPAMFATAAQKEREHLVFWKGTPQELEVYKIYGRESGPTVMIMGGIQGDEPGGFLSADLYADLALKRGNLIVVPRANFLSVVRSHRGPGGDMNRKFQGDLADDPERNVVDVLKCLMAQADVLLNLHDGSGYYRPTWESDMANPKRYGQCVIADSDVYRHEASGKTIELAKYAEAAVARVNGGILEPQHKFHFFNMFTMNPDTHYKEQRKSATYYALTQLGIPAFGIETSKQLPSLEMKVYQHNLAVNAFLEIYGVEVEHPRIVLEAPKMGYMVISVNGKIPLAVADMQTLLVAPGDTIEVVHVGANYGRGISVEVQGSDGLNDLHRQFRIRAPTTVLARKENAVFGRVQIGLLPSESLGDGLPRLAGEAKITSPGAAVPADASTLLAAMASPPATAATDAQKKQITAFLIEVDGQEVEIAPGKEHTVMQGSKVKLVDIKSVGGTLPKGVVMNLRGFVSKSNEARNTGEDRGNTVNTATDLMRNFSEKGKGQVYAINAELGSEILASCALRIALLQLDTVTIRFNGVTKKLRAGSRSRIPEGTRFELLEVTLKNGAGLSKPRYTLAGRPCPSGLPQTLTMRDIAVNLAVFNADVPAGKITFTPWSE